MNAAQYIAAGDYRGADRCFAAKDQAVARRRKVIAKWAADVALMAIDQQHEPEWSGDLPHYRDCLEMDLCDALRSNIPNVTNAECVRAVELFRAALPPQFND